MLKDELATALSRSRLGKTRLPSRARKQAVPVHQGEGTKLMPTLFETFKTRAEAAKRLRQVEYFKHNKG